MSYEKVELTADQRKMWADTMSLMAWTAPGFTHLWYRLLNKSHNEYVGQMCDFEGVACTDGSNVMFNPKTFFAYPLKQRAFICAHEIVHNVFDDVGTIERLRGTSHITCTDGAEFPYSEDIMQKVMDYRINALLVEGRIGQMPPDALYDPDIAKAKEGIYDIYGRVYKQDENGGPGGNGKGGPGSKPGTGNSDGNNGFDNAVQPPGTSTPGQTPQTRNQQQWQMETATAQRMEQQRTHGNMSAALKHLFDEILQPTVPWTDYIEVICKRLIGTGAYTWKKPDRRFITRDLYMPGRSGQGAGWLVVWGDTSGSIGEAELNKYLGELRGVIEDTHPARLTVIWCDAAIRHVDEITDMADLENVKARGVGGRGGTSVEPVFEWISEQRGEVPDMFIGLTDGALSFPEKPLYPTVWATVDKSAEFPYGEVVGID